MSYLLQDLFARPSLNVLLGPFGSKKTSLAIDLAVSVATRGGWLAFRGPQSPALFIDQALGDSALTARVRSALFAHRSSSATPFFFTSHFHSIADPREFEFLLSTALSIKAGLVVFDSPFGFDLYLDRHKLHSFFPVLTRLRQLAVSANAAVLLLHDLSKHRSDLANPLMSMGVDHVLATEFTEGHVHIRTLSSGHQLPISIVAYAHAGAFTLSPIAPAPVTLGAVGKKVLGYLASVDFAPTQAIISSVSANSGRVGNVITELLTDGYIRRANPGGRGKPALYQLTPAGRHFV